MNEKDTGRFGAETIHELVLARAGEFPGRVAVTAGPRQLSYGDLDRRARRLAGILRGLGAGIDVPVALYASRGIAMIVGALGIMAAGSAYLPIDDRYPQQRVDTLLRDSGAGIAVVTSAEAAKLASAGLARGVRVVVLDDDGNSEDGRGQPADGRPDRAAGERDLAYVIYTSGSAGPPKGVRVEHRNAVRLFEQTSGLFGLDDRDVWTVFHSISFDFSVWEIWGALVHGARAVLVDHQTTREPGRLHRLIRTEQVTVLSLTPSAFRPLVADVLRRPDEAGAGPGGQTAASSLRLVVLGGERLDVKLLEPWLTRYGDESPALVNMYGITETTVHVTHRRLRAADLGQPGISPIGVPLPGLGIELAGPDGRPVADGEPGEILVSGTGVARGYLNRPELTAEKFVVSGGRRTYRSGDLAVRLPGGDYAYLGRTDDQLKVRGFRIEPGEIESVLAEHPRVGTALVAAQEFGHGDVRLIAYLVPQAGQEPAPEADRQAVADLAGWVRERLPPHAWPSRYRVVTRIPLTFRGKADRATLGSLPFEEYWGWPEAAAGDGERTETETETETTVTQIVAEIMRGPGIGRDADMFACGVTSLAFIRILTSINQRFGLELTGAELDEATIRQLAACVDEQLPPRRSGKENR